MTTLTLLRAAAAAAALLPLPAAAATLADTYSSFFVFGDSLSDDGNLPPPNAPPPPYFDGRFSNGPVWAETVALSFPQSENFAFGGSRALGGLTSFANQVDLFDVYNDVFTVGPRPLASVWFGANDLLQSIGFSDVEVAISDAVAGIGAGIIALISEGVNDFVVFNLPDLGLTPLYNSNAAIAGLASLATEQFNLSLMTLIDDFGPAARITTVNIADLNDEIVDMPLALGLTNITDACLVPGESFCGPEADSYAFFDSVHPTRVVHARIADEALEALTPVPLPAAGLLLIGALGLLGATARRRQAAAA